MFLKNTAFYKDFVIYTFKHVQKDPSLSIFLYVVDWPLAHIKQFLVQRKPFMVDDIKMFMVIMIS